MKRERKGKSLYRHCGSSFAGCGQSVHKERKEGKKTVYPPTVLSIKRETKGKRVCLYPHSGSSFAGCGQSLSASAAYLGKLSAWSTVRAAGTEEEEKKKPF